MELFWLSRVLVYCVVAARCMDIYKHIIVGLAFLSLAGTFCSSAFKMLAVGLWMRHACCWWRLELNFHVYVECLCLVVSVLKDMSNHHMHSSEKEIDEWWPCPCHRQPFLAIVELKHGKLRYLGIKRHGHICIILSSRRHFLFSFWK